MAILGSRWTFLVLATVLILGGRVAPANAVLHGVTGDGGGQAETLFTIDPVFGDPYGTLGGKESGGTGAARKLVIIEPVTGVAADRGSFGDRFAGIAFAPTTTAAPEPAMLALFGLGLMGLGCLMRRGRTK